MGRMETQTTNQASNLQVVPQLPHETLYVGIDVGKYTHSRVLSLVLSCTAMNASRAVPRWPLHSHVRAFARL